jgi:hypothetical protein
MVQRGDHCHLYTLLSHPLPKAVINLKDNGQEVASLRGAGAYVVGPYSHHPEGRIYIPSGTRPATLTDEETTTLLALFGVTAHSKLYANGQSTAATAQPHAPNQTSSHPYDSLNPDLVAALTAHFKQRHFHQRGQWLNGPCPQAERHKPPGSINMKSALGIRISNRNAPILPRGLALRDSLSKMVSCLS